MQLAFGWLGHGDEGRLSPASANTLLYRAFFSNGYTCWTVAPARIGTFDCALWHAEHSQAGSYTDPRDFAWQSKSGMESNWKS